mmetsp:Transcript_35487/g.77719  ORF Transcript_35487/g.77719 Transcript_35487/m.77719 type:complete len:336 (+) Transcript_35487:77-1084(+)
MVTPGAQVLVQHLYRRNDQSVPQSQSCIAHRQENGSSPIQGLPLPCPIFITARLYLAPYCNPNIATTTKMGLKDYGPKTRRNVLLIIAFYVGVIGIWAGMYEMREPKGRKLPALNPLGCPPYKRYSCPASMACVLDFEYAPYYGRCTCDIVRAQVTRPPVFDDQELDDPWTATNNCKTDYFSASLQLVITLPIIFSLGMFGKVAVSTLWRLVKQNDLFKWNSTTRGLVILILTYSVSFQMYHIFYLLNIFGLDKHQVMHDYIANLGSFLLEFSYNVGSYELTISWFDLVQRTIKMSRTSSKSMTGIKIFIRLFNVGWNLHSVAGSGQICLPWILQ